MNTAVSVADSLASKSSNRRTRVLTAYFLVCCFLCTAINKNFEAVTWVTQNTKDDKK